MKTNHTIIVGDIVLLIKEPGLWRVTRRYRKAFEREDRVDLELVATDALLPPRVVKHRRRIYINTIYRMHHAELDQIWQTITMLYTRLKSQLRD